MKILGISGFANSVEFKKAQWPHLSDREYRIVQGLDSAAALIIDGQLVAAAAEERFNRHKHSGSFPQGAINYCLAEAGVSLDDIDEIVHAFNYRPHKLIYSLDQASAELYRQVYSPEAVIDRAARSLGSLPRSFRHLDHHLAHAASAYYFSGLDECLVGVFDGMGETQGTSIYHGHDGRLHRIASINARDSLGIFYSLVTFHLGFDFNADEYKIMGLAPYGDPSRFRDFFERAIQLNADGTVSIPLLHLNRARDERETYAATRRYLDEFLLTARTPDGELNDDHRDVAAALQESLNRAILHICRSFGAQTGARRLVMAGGVALNCTANGILLRSEVFEDVFIQPAAGDDGSALGAAAFRSAEAGELGNRRIDTPFFGPAYSESSIAKALEQYTGRIDITQFGGLSAACAKAAELIAAGCVIGWYRGRMEYGPRALGHRSILADPSGPEMRARINAMVKMREAFRPFAPAVTLREAPRWFEVPAEQEYPYMITTADVRPEYRRALPAITHVDGSARLQTVAARDNFEFHALLEAVGKKTGREMVLNTSFNVKGQPIVNTPEQAIETFLNCGIDFLFLENTLIKRKSENGKSRTAAPLNFPPDSSQLARLRHV